MQLEGRLKGRLGRWTGRVGRLGRGTGTNGVEDGDEWDSYRPVDQKNSFVSFTAFDKTFTVDNRFFDSNYVLTLTPDELVKSAAKVAVRSPAKEEV